MKPAIDALAQRCRVITFSLADEPSYGATFDESRGFWRYVDQVSRALDIASVQRACICGVSYGGLIAAAFAAQHPDRSDSLVLVSALPPTWTPNQRVRFYLQAPRLLTPLFLLASLRMYREIAAARVGMMRGAPAGISHAWRVLTHMFSPSRMARRVELLASVNLHQTCAGLTLPTLILTGEPELDRVVPVASTREFAAIVPSARIEVIPRTGHLGLITRPELFAALVSGFAEQAAGAAPRRRVG
jgi:pimeloyl-ACP methyl ester carboxylesterase